MGRGLDGFFFDIRALALCSFQGPRRGGSRPVSGGYGEGETPLPIPNRAVKPLSADGTWLARAWESRSPPVDIQQMAPPPSAVVSLTARAWQSECAGDEEVLPGEPSGAGAARDLAGPRGRHVHRGHHRPGYGRIGPNDRRAQRGNPGRAYGAGGAGLGPNVLTAITSRGVRRLSGPAPRGAVGPPPVARGRQPVR
jgi:hypothetical protein